MKKEITIYELAGLIKDNKAPKRIKFYGEEYYFDECESYVRYSGDKIINFEKDYPIFPSLNYKVEIIEEPKELEELKETKTTGDEFYCEYIGSWIKKEASAAYCEYLSNKMNEIIRYIKYKENK